MATTAPAHPFPIVGVGASAGGLEALTKLLDGLPRTPGLAIVVVQHLDPHSQSHLAEVLQPHTSLPVVDVTDGAVVRPDKVYVIRPNTQVALLDGVLSVTPRPAARPHYPVDHLFRSLAEVQGARAVGVILSGTGSDGTIGAEEIKAAGGVTFAQDGASAQHPGMPQSAVAMGAVDLILPPAEISARLAALPHELYVNPTAQPSPVESKDDFPRVIAALRTTSGVDFSQYRDTTLKRRTARRMMLRGFKTVAEYAKFVENDQEEAAALFRDVLINVTSFFRDPGMFEDLARQVFPSIVGAGEEETPIRVWVAGCSTGQEVYSVAIALTEFLETAGSHRPIQIFASDLGDQASLDTARAGVYPESIEADVSPQRLRRFFTREDSSYRVANALRELCVFTRHNVTIDPPFSRVDLITCRNVLMYMSSPLQDRLPPIFHFALNPGGFIVLGVAESLDSDDDNFELISRTHKIYRKKDGVRRWKLPNVAGAWLSPLPAARSIGASSVVDVQREAERVLLSHYAPPSVLVNERFEIQHFRGVTTPFLEAPTGQPTTSILRMAREGLFMELRSALAEAKASKAAVVREGLRVTAHGAEVDFTLRVLPVTPPAATEMCFLVLFETPTTGHPAVPEPVTLHATDRDVEWLQRELAASRQYLESVLGQQDVATQELRTAHEEVVSSNEELRSTNEELETTKEELQSTNEELVTVNEQFQRRNRDLDALTDDLSNFITSADLPMITVGRDLCIRRVTPAAKRPFNVLTTDKGRSIEHIKFALGVDAIAPVIEGVIATLQPWQQEATDRDGRWWLVRVLPFRTADDRIDGATVMAVDIDLVKRSGQLQEERDYARAVVQTVREPLTVLDHQCRVGIANGAFHELFTTTPEQVEGRALWDAVPVPWGESGLRQRLLAACSGQQALADLEVDCKLETHGRRQLVLNATPMARPDRPNTMLLAIEDVTDARAAEALRIDTETLRQVDRRKDEFLGILAHELRNPLAPMRFALELMRRADDDPASPNKVTKHRLVLERQVDHMVRLIDDLLDVSRVTQGKLELRIEMVSLQNVVQGAIELCRPAIEAARHEVKVSLPTEPVHLRADPVRLTQMLVNVLNNAVKFTPSGGHIYVLAETLSAGADDHDQVRIRIRDDGIGIAPELQPRIFDLFTQGDRSLERTRGGLGIGLTLVRNLARLHGGSVAVRSDGVDAGTEVTIDLPIERSGQPPAAAEPQLPATRSRALRILVADDNEDGREMMRFFLESAGHTVATAAEGESALAAVAEFHPEVAILDIGMPGLNGYQVAERIRQSEEGAAVVLIAISGLGQEEDKRRAAEAGFDLHFTKPADIGALTKALTSVSQGRLRAGRDDGRRGPAPSGA